MPTLIVKLDDTDGSLIWKYAFNITRNLEVINENIVYQGAVYSTYIEGDRIYVAGIYERIKRTYRVIGLPYNFIACLRDYGDSLSLEWFKTIDGVSEWGTSISSVLSYNGYLYVNGDTGYPYILCLNKSSGELLWARKVYPKVEDRVFNSLAIGSGYLYALYGGYSALVYPRESISSPCI